MIEECSGVGEESASGGVYVSSGTTMYITNSSLVSSNYAAGSGGGVYVGTRGLMVMTSLTQMLGNKCQMTGGGVHGAQAVNISISGGAQLRANTAMREGGGIALLKGLGTEVEESSLLSIEESVLTGNRANLYSGGAISSDDFCVVKLRDVTLEANIAGYTGGAVNSLDGYLEVVDSLVAGNFALFGGGISVLGTRPTAGYLCVSTTTIVANVASGFGGGIALTDFAHTLLGLPGSCGDAVAEVSSGVMEGQRTGQSVRLTGNQAERGSAIHIENSGNNVMQGVVLTNNTMVAQDSLTDDTSVLNLMRAEVYVVGCHFEGNVGCAVYATQGSNMSLAGAMFARHVAVEGSALHLSHDSAAVAVNCAFLSGRARHGGAVHTSGRLAVAGSRFEGNLAESNGGAIYLQLRLQATNISQCVFMNNSVEGEVGSSHVENGNGGAMYLSGSEEFDGVVNRTWLYSLSFDGNSAEHGGAVGFWQPQDLLVMPEPPRCFDCNLTGSNSAEYGNMDGWATQALYLQVDPVQQEGEASQDLAYPIYVRITDLNGETVTVDSSSVVQLHFVDDSVCNVQDGAKRVTAVNGVASFPEEDGELVLRGNPGTRCKMYFSSSLDSVISYDVVSNITEVPLRHCLPGEELKGESPWQYCSQCEAGSLSLDNQSACLNCQAELEYCNEVTMDDSDPDNKCPLSCPGGNEYVVCQGAYLAPSAQHCGSDTRCLLARASVCEQEAACTTNTEVQTCGLGEDGNAGRVGRGADAVAELRLCEEEMYIGSQTVLCGSKVPVVCSDDHYSDLLKLKCRKCGSTAEVLTTAIAGLSLVLLLLAMIFAFYLTAMKQALEEHMMSGEAQATSVQVLKARQAASLILGYVQVRAGAAAETPCTAGVTAAHGEPLQCTGVMGQLSNVYSESVLPTFVKSFANNINVLNIDLSLVVNLRCFKYYFLPSLQGSSFMFSLWQAVLEPYLLAAIFAALYVGILRSRQKGKRKKAAAAEEQSGKPPGDEQDEAAELEWRGNMQAVCMGAYLFVMMFVHPAISTITFQLFNCEALYFEDPSHKQTWCERLAMAARPLPSPQLALQSCFRAALSTSWITQPCKRGKGKRGKGKRGKGMRRSP
ncbi:hypothetical protein CYMTET_34568 [Cymbomonas tetramitiformis]|uniref:Right handed beta helix domain-containing protein n=1 Tax=Cymbomonas tetramitiformis TaxID=36881 RepID=A0AAE0FAW5_9CHLO|nr:hypothetical protein CYMTET_34568 [Cymbomonas tetramitiformis]